MRLARTAVVTSVLAASVVTPALIAPAPARAASQWTPESARYGVGEQSNLPVNMSDGTVLRVNVYTPTDPATGKAAAGSFPVLLTQTPYGKSELSADTYFVQRGYIEVVADVRGTGSSGGTFGLFDPAQGRDGAALVRWSSRLAHSDGKVGLFGESYMGINQFLTVDNLKSTSPVKAIFPVISANDIYRDTAFDGGLFDSEFNTAYTGLEVGLQTSEPTLETLQAPSSESPSDLGSTQAQHAGSLAGYFAPTAADVELNGNEAYDGAYWADRSPASVLSKVVSDNIPAFLVGGWYDLFQHGEPLNYVSLQNLYDHRPAGAAMTPGQKVTGRYQLLMGPWYHLTAGDGINLDQIQLEWFDTWLKSESTGMASTPTPLHLNVLGTSRYVDTAIWGATGAASALYLQPGGSLGAQKPAKGSSAQSLAFTGASAACDRETSQWMMGADNLALGDAGLGSDPCTTQDADIQSGPGATTFTSAPVSADTVLSGPMDLSLAATDTATDAEWIANIEDVSPSGQSTPLTAGALLGSMRAVNQSRTWKAPDGRPLLAWHPYTEASVQAVKPGAITRYDVEIFATFALVPKGDRIRVTISTSDTPHLMPTPQQLSRLSGGVYQIGLNAGAASWLELSMVPASRFATTCSLCR